RIAQSGSGFFTVERRNNAMNLKTTIFLTLLLGAGAGGWVWFETRQPKETARPTADFLENSLDVAKVTRIEATRGTESQFVLERTGDEWHLPGKWPVRTQEVEQWFSTLTS